MNDIVLNTKAILNSLNELEYFLTQKKLSTDTVVILKSSLVALSKSKKEKLITFYSYESLLKLLPYINTSFQFYESKEINLSTTKKIDLILSFINTYDQVIQAEEDMFVINFLHNKKSKFKNMIEGELSI